VGFKKDGMAVRTAQRLKSLLVLQSPPSRTKISSVLTALVTAISHVQELLMAITRRDITCVVLGILRKDV
jgi:hypothetical protein